MKLFAMFLLWPLAVIGAPGSNGETCICEENGVCFDRDICEPFSFGCAYGDDTNAYLDSLGCCSTCEMECICDHDCMPEYLINVMLGFEGRRLLEEGNESHRKLLHSACCDSNECECSGVGADFECPDHQKCFCKAASRRNLLFTNPVDQVCMCKYEPDFDGYELFKALVATPPSTPTSTAAPTTAAPTQAPTTAAPTTAAPTTAAPTTAAPN